QVMLKYTKADGVVIQSEDLTILANIIEPANLQLQLGSVINENGLIAVGNNNFKAGPNSGEVIYSVASNNGFASVTSGKLESSNVDLTKQFAELIVAQRSIEANSRTFTTISNVLQNLIQMGR
ncbi:MAG: flagellar basal body rod C-terminal domain-containing protein, partial [Candidatus Gastranaerophilales bacterium]|nr:flagellar basal body rod C-terminal domain-containing protein [Candidatus Gastranaerophilales bacterium]